MLIVINIVTIIIIIIITILLLLLIIINYYYNQHRLHNHGKIQIYLYCHFDAKCSQKITIAMGPFSQILNNGSIIPYMIFVDFIFQFLQGRSIITNKGESTTEHHRDKKKDGNGEINSTEYVSHLEEPSPISQSKGSSASSNFFLYCYLWK